MQDLLEHFVQNYSPLPSELRPRRVRSRTSPYFQAQARAAITKIVTPPSPEVRRTPVPVLQHACWIYGSQDGARVDKAEHGQVVDRSEGECHWTRIGYDVWIFFPRLEL
jgi:hypothetical protein